MAEFIIEQPDGSTRRQTFLGDEAFVGRDPAVDIVLADPKISRRHARLWRRGEIFWAEDLGSSNGTQLDGVPLTQATKLTEGSRLSIGPFTLTLRGELAAPSAPPTFVLSSRQPQRVADILLSPAIDAQHTGEAQIIGRGEDVQVIIADQSISRRHAQVRATLEGVEVFDFDSSNGTFINDLPVKNGVLAPGDTLRLGNMAFVVMLAQPTAAVPAAAVRSLETGPTKGAPERFVPRTSRWAFVTGSVRALTHRIPAWRARSPVGRRTVALALVVVVLVAVALLAQRAFRGTGTHQKSGVGSLSSQAKHGVLALLGRGPTPGERRRLAELEKGLARAHALELKDNAASTDRAWSDVLDLEPMHAEAIVGLFWARELQRDKSALSLAAGELAQGNGREALAAVASALDTPWSLEKGDSHTPLQNMAARAALRRTAVDAQEMLAQANSTRGTQACLDGQFDRCLTFAAAALGFSATGGYGQVLVGWVHDVMGEPYQDMKTRYPEAPLRQAMWAYAAGADEGALVRLKPLRCPRCTEAMDGVKRLLQRRHEAESAQHGAEPQRALELYEDCRSDDASLIPASVPSAARRKLAHAMQDAYVSLGRAAISRGAYGDALEALEQGSALSPGYPAIDEQLAELVIRAEQMLELWVTQQKASAGFTKADACLPLRDIVAMTPMDAPVHHRALTLLDACRSGKLKLDKLDLPSAPQVVTQPS